MSKPTKTTILRDPQELISEEQEKHQRLTAEDLSIKVQQAEDVLMDLERRREQLERQKRQLEELRRKQREFEEGQHDIQEKLTRGLVLLERQEFELKREAEQVQIIRKQFDDQLGSVQQIQAQEWETDNLEEELTRALATVDQARAIYVQAQARMEAVKRQSGGDLTESLPDENLPPPQVGPADFSSRVAAGFAYSLPGLIGLFLLTLIWKILQK